MAAKGGDPTDLKKELAAHPDAEFRDYILNGIMNGFRVGFNQAVGHL
jgi:hypothetical protein